MQSRSHFSLGKPVDGDKYFGRSKELLSIRDRLQAGSAINFFSLRRMGKSSTLKQIQFLSKNNSDWQQFQPVFVDVLGLGDINHFAIEVAQRLTKQDEVPDQKFAWKVIENHKNFTDKTILLLDEADTLFQRASQQDLGVLRSMQQEGVFNIAYCKTTIQQRHYLTTFSIHLGYQYSNLKRLKIC